jgi:hypothetical protein
MTQEEVRAAADRAEARAREQELGNRVVRKRMRAPGGGRKPLDPRGSDVVPARIPVDTLRAVDRLTKKGRTRSDIVRDALNYWIRRHRSAERPRHIGAFAELVARVTLAIEHKTKRHLNEDRYTATQVAAAIELLLWQYSPRSKAAAPPAVAAAAKAMPAQARDAYPSQLGAIEAGAIIAQLESVPQPPTRPEPPTRHYPEDWQALWYIRADLKPSKLRRHK